MDDYVSEREQLGSARRRHNARQRRRATMVRRREETPTLRERAGLLVQNAPWYGRRQRLVLTVVVVLAVVVIGLFIATNVLAGRIFPNVWVMGIYIGDMTENDAQTALLDAWYNDIPIELADNDRIWTVSPVDLGLSLGARQTAEAAVGVGLAGIPFGYEVSPVVEVDFSTAQSYLLDLADRAEIAPLNAGFEWRDDKVVGVPGRDGSILDVTATVEYLSQDLEGVLQSRRLDLFMARVAAEVIDPEPYLEEARQIVGQPFWLSGYDPFTDEYLNWTATHEEHASWLEVGASGLRLREDAFVPAIETMNATLNSAESATRYLDIAETTLRMNEALKDRQSTVQFRIRYRPSTYEVIAGDTAYKISRKTGIPFFMIEESNSGRDLSVLSVGDVLNLPSRDVTIPLEPVANKRIVVDLDTQSLAAYESGQEVFRWRISSGIASAPTSPGIYQILSHDPVAYGSSYALCGETGCGQWELNWFMGIYEVVPGLVNGFHGAVLLPDGSYLGGNNVGTPYTLGCVMSRDDQAKLLYDWAEEGTVVEILSREFDPESNLGRQAFS